MEQIFAEYVNVLAEYCGIRDIESLTQGEMNRIYGLTQADVMVLFGGSILAGGDVLAEGIRNHIAKTYIIVGGAGHTTETLRQQFHSIYPVIDVSKLFEAEIFDIYIAKRCNLKADYLECDSTNCGNNITYLLDLLDREHIECKSMILVQDATMQRRMNAGLRKYRPDILAINYAAYQVKVIDKGSSLAYADEVVGMWNMERYITLLLGEIPRLTDDVNGYGPRGKDFIAHVDVPSKVRRAFELLSKSYEVRKARGCKA